MKTLQECKEEVAVKNQYGSWDDASRFLVGTVYKPYRLQQLNDEAAELYASQFKSRIAELEKEVAFYKGQWGKANEALGKRLESKQQDPRDSGLDDSWVHDVDMGAR